MFFEEHTDAQFFQFPDVLQTLFRISGEPGYGLYEDLIDPSFTAVRQHSLEIIPLGGGGSRDAFICIDLRKLPAVVFSDVVIVIGLLGSEAVELILRVGTDTAISGNPQLGRFRL